MSKLITTTVLKPHMGPDGTIVQCGATITVDEARHRQLARKGYVPRLDGDDAKDATTAPREGLTNADFNPRRSPIVGDELLAVKTKRATAKAGTVKTKRATPPEQPQQSTEGAGEA